MYLNCHLPDLLYILIIVYFHIMNILQLFNKITNLWKDFLLVYSFQHNCVLFIRENVAIPLDDRQASIMPMSTRSSPCQYWKVGEPGFLGRLFPTPGPLAECHWY